MRTDEEVPKRPRGRPIRAVSLADCLEKRDARVGGWIAKCEAEKKDQKNYEKWVKDTEKARSKSSANMAEFYDAILEIATGSVPNK